MPTSTNVTAAFLSADLQKGAPALEKKDTPLAFLHSEYLRELQAGVRGGVPFGWFSHE